EGVPRHEIADHGGNVAPAGNPVIARAHQDILAVDSRDMNDDLAVIMTGKNEPRIAVIGETACGIDPQTRLEKRSFNPIKLGNLARRPIPAALEQPTDWYDVRGHSPSLESGGSKRG